MNVKKKSKLEREDKTNGNPLLHHGIYFFFHKIFPMNIHNDFFLFFSVPCYYFLNNECKKYLEIREGTHLQWKPTSTPWIFFVFAFTTFFSVFSRFSSVSGTSTIRAHSTISETCPLIVRNRNFEQLARVARAKFFSHFRGVLKRFVF